MNKLDVHLTLVDNQRKCYITINDQTLGAAVPTFDGVIIADWLETLSERDITILYDYFYS